MINAAQVLHCDLDDLIDEEWRWTVLDAQRAPKPPTREQVADIGGREWWHYPKS